MSAHDQLRRRCEQLVAEIDVPEPFDIHELCRIIGDERAGRPIVLIPIALPARTVCGMYVPTGKFDAIFYEQDTSPLHQMLIIGHELGHLLAGHRASASLDPDTFRLLLPDLDPRLIQRFLGRSNYDAAEEREAEMIGSLLLRRARRGGARPPAPVDDRQAALNHRLRLALEDPTG
ncbi:MAG TPA: hypothetical protein VN408_06630 [Actinoplanes sp.]|nr:hypothetical protein [Actinoplanes sp.]